VSLPLFAADETHVIKFKYDVDTGRTIQFRSADVETGSMRAFDAEGKKTFEASKEGGEISYRSTVLERDKEGKVTKYVRVYEKANEKEDGKVKTFSYEGKTILYEKIDGKFRIGVVGDNALDSKDSAKLIKDANGKSESEALFRNLPPAKPIKIGDSWAVPVKPVAEAMDDAVVDLKKSSITAKLTKTYAKDKAKWGTFEIAMKLSINEMSEDGMKITFDPPAKFEVNVTIDAAIDGSSVERKEVGKLVLKAEGHLHVGDMKTRIEFDVKGTGTDEQSAEFYDPKAREVPKVQFIAGPNDWTEFKPKDASFQLKFPGTPKEKTKKGEGFTETQYASEVEGGVIIYSIAITDFEDPSKIDPAAVLKAAVASLKNVKSQKDITVNGHPGAEIVYEQEASGFKFDVSRQIIMVNRRAFEVSTVAVKGKKAETEKFFKSLQVLVKPMKKDD
jgi:hypothetical protein